MIYSSKDTRGYILYSVVRTNAKHMTIAVAAWIIVNHAERPRYSPCWRNGDMA